MYYASFGILSLVLHFIINHEVLRKDPDGSRPLATLRYRSFLISVMIYYVSDILWGLFYEWRIIPLAYTDTVIYFASMVLSVLLWTRYVVAYLDRKTRFSTMLTYAGWAICTYEFLNLIVNFFYPVVFAFDENKEYRPGAARYITLGIQILLYAVTAVYTLVIASKLSGKARIRHVTIGLSGVVMTIFIILQAMFPLLPFYAIGCLIATCMIHTYIEVDEKLDHERELGSAMRKAYTDPLTGVKNVRAYAEARENLDQRLKEGKLDSFGVVVFDLNGLKTVNDTLGHDEGDEYIRQACSYICKRFKHSPVYRIGGDEFVILLEGEDYEDREELVSSFDRQIEDNQSEGRVVVSSGLAEYLPQKDEGYDSVFERADRLMYERKKVLKDMQPSAG